jgi:signal transduction histidine kinase
MQEPPIDTKQKSDLIIQQLQSDKAILQGKFDIASNILHDIGNAVVGFGSYISRIKSSLDQNSIPHLQKLTDYFIAQQTAIGNAIGESKASAVIGMLNGMTEAQKNVHEEISKSIIEQLNIITHIQDILNIQRQYVNGHELPEKAPTSLRNIVSDCMSMLFASIEKRKINISVCVPEKLPLIRADRTKLMQVLLNILKNSIEAIDINGTEKSISLKVQLTADELVVQIKDSGHGFDQETGEQLFERGFTTKSSGSGIGLSNCKSIIESHGGTIDIRSEGCGRGAQTTITFKLSDNSKN